MPAPPSPPDPNLDLFAWRARKPEESQDPSGPRSDLHPPLTVTQLNNQARTLLEQRFGAVTVVGEISNYTRHSSGHHYFSLKDRDAQLPAAFFRREASRLKFRLEAGMEVLVTGRLTIYGKAGRYQIIVERVEPLGAGALQAAFEELKRRLANEGLFAEERKRPLPVVPQRVGVVTSPTGAVIRDIVNVSTRRFPQARLLVIPTRVQGAESAAEIARAIGRAGEVAERYGLEVLIVARGGGSLEDLWGFNEERVARAIAACPIPVVSADGHETDFTIADFVADHRAPTPSAAAELVFPVRSALVEGLTRDLEGAARSLRRDLEARRLRLTAERNRLGDGRALTREPSQRLSEIQQQLEQRLRLRINAGRLRLGSAEKRLALAHPQVRLRGLRDRMTTAAERLGTAMRRRLREERRDLASATEVAVPLHRRLQIERRRLNASAQRLDALSPRRVLERGYAILLAPDGTAIKDPNQVEGGDALTVELAKGRLRVRVDK